MMEVEVTSEDGGRIVEKERVDPLARVERLVKRLEEHNMAELTVLKEAVADVAVAEEAVVTYVQTLETELAAAKAGEGSGTEAEQTEVNELASSATTSADALKALVPAPPAA
jgi:hypothetical protein